MKEGEAGKAYEEACADLEELGPKVQDLLKALLKQAGLTPHSVSHRIKNQQSVVRKLGTKGSAYTGIQDMHDLLGLRIITYFPDEVDRAAQIIEQEFAIDRENSVDKRALLDPDRFGYLSLHYVATLSDQRASLSENIKFADRRFEIQIRSILQHAWAEIEHDLGYHTPGSIPDSLRRRFSRLAGLLELADDEFQHLRNDVRSYRASVRRDLSSAPDELSVNRDSVAALIRGDSTVRELDQKLAEIAGVKLRSGHERVPNARAEEMVELGFESIAEVSDCLRENRDLVQAFFLHWDALHELNHAYRGMSLFILSYVLAAQWNSIPRLVSFLRDIHIGGTDAGRKTLAKEIRDTYVKAAPAR